MASNGRDASGHESLPPSCRYVLFVLDDHQEASRQELLELTDLPERTLDEALRTLENCDLVLKARKSEDPTQVVCKIRDSHYR